MRALLNFILFVSLANAVICDCGSKLYSKIYSEDENFPSIVTIIDNNKNFMCNAVIVGKRQIVSDNECLLFKNVGDFSIHFNIPTLTDEKIINPSQISKVTREDETQFKGFQLINVTTVHFYEEIDEEYFFFPLMLMQSFRNDEPKLDIGVENLVNNENRCKHIELIRLKETIVVMPYQKKSKAANEKNEGAYYFQVDGNWFLYGLYEQDFQLNKIKNLNQKFKSVNFNEIKRYFSCYQKSSTKAVGTKSKRFFCPGDVLFEENFDAETFRENWRFDETLSGGRNWEFQWLSPDSNNSFIKDGKLNIKPTLTIDMEGKDESYLTSGVAQIAVSKCTDKRDYGCLREGQYGLINPIRSAGISTINTIAFKYATVEIRAKIAAGDWLSSIIKLEPKSNIYGKDLFSPYNGDIGLLEARGNRNYTDEANNNIGNQRSTCRIQFSKDWKLQYRTKQNENGFSEDFHMYKMTWTSEKITMFIDDEITCEIEAPIWENYQDQLERNPDYLAENPWPSENKFAPFDQLFYLTISLRCGGISFYPDGLENLPHEKPWKNNSPRAKEQFWAARNHWEPTWIEGQREFQIDYVKILAT